ncbi:uncharacterized protein LOC133814683 [Humulus lupulus]|uniref:uncharacterized protein LOC133814683 n=1 Tax=Humulus lupulus TaxID=3486 RepID=UPI002B4086DE|nr:uncharacterized protein LOC133814683 [Humulus lupulus]
MVKKKKLARKPVTRSIAQRLPSIQDENDQDGLVLEDVYMNGEELTQGVTLNDVEMGVTDGGETQNDAQKAFEMATPSSWADKVEAGDFQKLEYAEPLIKDGKRIARVDIDEVKIQSTNWSSAVICMVLGANPPMAVFEGFIKRVWGHLRIAQIARMTMGLIMVKFNDDATRDHVLENGILHFDRKPMIIRPWTTDLSAFRMICSVPLWIRLHDLGLQYWGSKCLSAFVSTIGKPIMVDKFTRERSRVQFARILVEVEITDNPPRIMHYLNEQGQLTEQGVDYEWLPVKCKTCSGYGHSMADCRKEMKTQWVKKDNFPRTSPEDGRDKDEQSLGAIPDVPKDLAEVPNVVEGLNARDKWQSPKKMVPLYKQGPTKSKNKRASKSVETRQNLTNHFEVLQEQLEGEKGGIGNVSSSYG